MKFEIQPKAIQKSKRKTLVLMVNSAGELIVKAPLKCKEEHIAKFIAEKSAWILKKQQEAKDSINRKIVIENDKEISILGQTYTIRLQNVSRCKFSNCDIIVPNQNSQTKFVNFLKGQAKKYIHDRVEFYSQRYGFSHKGISITSATSRWGSCGGKNTLNFTFKLMLCPIEVVDYVVVHELCHTKQKNHSLKFWQLVAEILPNYKTLRRWLKTNNWIITSL